MADVTEHINTLQNDAIAAVAENEATLVKDPRIWSDVKAFAPTLTEFSDTRAKIVTESWRDLLPRIIAK